MPLPARFVSLADDWRMLRAAWRALPDNPLWVLRQRQKANADPARRRVVRSRLMLWGGVGLLVYALIVVQVTADSYSSNVVRDWIVGLTYFCVGPVVVALLYCIVQLAQRAQAWLALDRFDAKRSSSALFDPLLGMTPLTPTEVVAAAVRDLAPLILTGSGLAALATFVVIFGSRIASITAWGTDGLEEFMTALVFSPLTLASLLLVGCLGGLILVLVFLCLGLGDRSLAQRGGWTFAAVAHQLFALPLSFGYLPETDYNHQSWKVLAVVAIALALTAGVVALSARLAFGRRRISPAWLPGLPGGLVIAGLISFVLMQSMGFGSSSHDSFAITTFFQCSAWWSSLSLASPGCVPLLQCYGELFNANHDEQWLTTLNFGVTVCVQCALLVGAYRCALFCAARRLRAGA